MRKPALYSILRLTQGNSLALIMFWLNYESLKIENHAISGKQPEFLGFSLEE